MASAAPRGAEAGYTDEIGSALLPLRSGSDAAISAGRQAQMRISRAGRIVADVYVSGDIAVATERLRAAGMSVVATATDPVPVAEGWIPLDRVDAVAQLARTDAVLPVPAGDTDVGSVTSGGVVSHQIPLANTLLPSANGAGVDVGIISDSMSRVGTGVAGSQATGDLPLNTQVMKEGFPGGTDEGRAMAEIVYDEAPGVNRIMFAAGSNLGPVDKANSIKLLADNGADVIADDIFYLTEPFFQDGTVAQAVDEAKAAGVAYFASAGNRARQSYAADYSDSGGMHDFDPGPGTEVVQSITNVSNGGFIQLALDWDEPWGGAQTDLNVDLVKPTGAALPGPPVLGGADDNPAIGLPREVATWSNTTGATQAVAVRITRVAGTRSPFMKYIVRKNTSGFAINAFPTNSPAINPDAASAKGALAIAAVAADDPGLNSPETFTSRGPVTRLFDISGNRLAVPEVLAKPDVAAADKVVTTVPGFLPFSGTSAAAPSAAGIAAILRSANPGAGVNEVYEQMTDPTHAIDCTASLLVPDPDCGAGFLLAPLALAGLDRTGPGVSRTLAPARPNGRHGWYTRPIRITWTGVDPESSLESAPCPVTTDRRQGTNSFSCTVRSGGGVTTGEVRLRLDTVRPRHPRMIGLRGRRFKQGDIPPARRRIRCRSADGTSGLASCRIGRLSSKLGRHVLVAVATDRAGLRSVRRLRYRVTR